MSDLQEDTPAAVVDIAENGDILLVVDLEQLKLRVQSLILKATSKPFAAMLSSNWMEGREKPSTETPVEILLPEDDAIGLKYICAITHSRGRMIPEALSTEDLLKVAIMADKYDFFDALDSPIRYWLHPREDDAKGNMRLLAVAYLFRNVKAFKENTRALVMKYDGSYIDLYTKQIEVIIDWRVIYWLEEQRNSVRLRLINMLRREPEERDFSHEPECDWRTFDFLELSNLVSKNKLSLSDSMERSKSCKCSCTKKRSRNMSEPSVWWQMELIRVEDCIQLCLSCVRLDEPNPGNCRLPNLHDESNEST